MYAFFDVDVNVIKTSEDTLPISVDTFGVSYRVTTVPTDNIFLHFKLLLCTECLMLSYG
jgi:hypothetical protein